MSFYSRNNTHTRFITVSLFFIFLFSLCSIYWMISSPIVDEAFSLTSQQYSHSQESISDQVPPRYASALLYASPPVQGNLHNFETVEAEIKERIDRVDKLCQIHHLGRYKWALNGSNDLAKKEPPTPLYSYFFWNRERRLAWCPVYKAGSTSWLYNMMILAGFSDQQLKNPSKQLSFLARDIYGDAEPDEKTLEQSFKLLIVRHPFERLVSAYRDKLSNSSVGLERGTFHFYTKYGKKIVRKFRKDKSIAQIEPTWEEFVRYLLATDLLQYSDDHWLPAYYSCTPCLVHYDVIAKVETLNRDQEYVIYKAGLEGIIKPRWNHKLQTNNKPPDLIKFYFSQLSKAQIEQLYQKYWFDFQLFGYDHKKFLKYGKSQ